MPNSFISNQINNNDILEEPTEYITDVITNSSSFTEAKIMLNPDISKNIEDYNEVTIENIVIAKNKLIDRLTNTNKNLMSIVINYNKDTININNYIENLSAKICDNKKLSELKTELVKEKGERKDLQTAYRYLTNEYLTLKRTYNGLNRVYIDNVINYFKDDNKKQIEILKDENTKLKTKFLCKICFTNNINVILNPCGHIAICNACISGMVQYNTTVNCPLCNTCIETYNNIFIPI